MLSDCLLSVNLFCIVRVRWGGGSQRRDLDLLLMCIAIAFACNGFFFTGQVPHLYEYAANFLSIVSDS